ncbi:MAG: AAA family ATPase [Ramlibacter sp.]
MELLSRSRNVLISGPPGTGKSKLLAEVAEAFAQGAPTVAGGGVPTHQPKAKIPIPPAGGVVDPAWANIYPSANNKNRKVFRTVFHQNSKYRDFVTGLAPSVKVVAGTADFRVMPGTLYKASEHARQPGSASLLIIDEINRGPAVQVFGGSIVAMESDKRLAPGGAKRSETQFFELMDPATGDIVEYALPHDLYILAAMNQADASVEPLDVAFLRRWEPMRLEPDEAALRTFYGLPPGIVAPLPPAAASTNNALAASVRAWKAINQQISIGRGPEFQIGHGVLMADVNPQAMNLLEALAFLAVGWAKVRAHVEEVFFGDVRGVATVLNARNGVKHNPFALEDIMFSDELRHRLNGPLNLTAANIYDALRAFARE